MTDHYHTYKKKFISNIKKVNTGIAIETANGKSFKIPSYSDIENATSVENLQDIVVQTIYPPFKRFEFLGPINILADQDNVFTIPVSNLDNTYQLKQLISVEFNVEFSDLTNLGCIIESPDTLPNEYLFSQSFSSQGLSFTGSDLTNCVIYNSNIELYPAARPSESPYTGTWSDGSDGYRSYFDKFFVGDTLNGDWKIHLETAGGISGVLNSIVLTFAKFAPEADFNIIADKPRLNERIQFIDTSSNTPTSWSWKKRRPGTWEFVEFSNDKDPYLTLDTAGDWEIKLTCSNSSGNSTKEYSVCTYSEVSFTYTGSTTILPGNNFFDITISEFSSPYTENLLQSLSLNITASDLSELFISLVSPDNNYEVILVDWNSLSGTNLIDTIFSINSNADISLSSAPYTGEFSSGWYQPDNGFNEFIGEHTNGNWTLSINNNGLNTYSLDQFNLHFLKPDILIFTEGPFTITPGPGGTQSFNIPVAGVPTPRMLKSLTINVTASVDLGDINFSLTDPTQAQSLFVFGQNQLQGQNINAKFTHDGQKTLLDSTDYSNYEIYGINDNIGGCAIFNINPTNNGNWKILTENFQGNTNTINSISLEFHSVQPTTIPFIVNENIIGGLHNGITNISIGVQGIPDPYKAGELVSIEFYHNGEVSDLECWINMPNFNATTQTLFSPIGSGADISGKMMKNTIFYNSSIQEYPSIETAIAPFSGIWTDSYDNTNFDDALIGVLNGTTLGEWSIYLEHYSTYIIYIKHIILTFAIKPVITFENNTPVISDGSPTTSMDVVVSGLNSSYEPHNLISLELDITCADLSTTQISLERVNYVFLQNENLTGANLTSTIFYNSSLISLDGISGGVAPYSGIWTDNEIDTGFDLAFAPDPVNGTWTINVFGLSNGESINSAKLKFYNYS